MTARWEIEKASRGISENINKARKAFFGYVGAFHGSLRPISSVSIIETCSYTSIPTLWCRKLDIDSVLIDRFRGS